ncbi:MAG TPA: HNH endonuclease [Patescibacteria group bacterium]|nr:HNH endonuclease [Patescibacteria group bacterium]
MKKLERTQIGDFLYKNKGSTGVARQGFYGLTRDVFELALTEYLKTGIDHLSEYDELTYLGWDLSGDEYSMEQISLLNRAMDHQTFWEIRALYTPEEIEEMLEHSMVSLSLINYRKSYSHRRKQGFTQKIKNDCKKRDEYKCKVCHSKEGLVIHHIKEVVKGGENELDNLITLCRNCHKKIHSKKGARK